MENCLTMPVGRDFLHELILWNTQSEVCMDDIEQDSSPETEHKVQSIHL